MPSRSRSRSRYDAGSGIVFSFSAPFLGPHLYLDVPSGRDFDPSYGPSVWGFRLEYEQPRPVMMR